MSFEFYNSFGVSRESYQASEEALQEYKEMLSQIEKLREHNQLSVIKAFQQAGLSASDFQFSTGYGYDDPARETVK